MKKILKLVLVLLMCNSAIAQEMTSEDKSVENYFVTKENEKVVIDEKVTTLIFSDGLEFRGENREKIMKSYNMNKIKAIVFGGKVFLRTPKHLREIIVFNDKYFMVEITHGGYSEILTIYDRETNEEVAGGSMGIPIRAPNGKIITENNHQTLRFVESGFKRLSFLTYFPEMENIYKRILKNQEDGNKLQTGISYYKSSEDVKDLITQYIGK